MGTTKAGQESKRTLMQNTNGSYMVSLPIEVVRALGWREGQKLTVRKTASKITIEDWKG